MTNRKLIMEGKCLNIQILIETLNRPSHIKLTVFRLKTSRCPILNETEENHHN
jgi:hypothetical protein